MRVFLTTMFTTLSLVAFGVNAQEPAEPAAEQAEAEAVAEPMVEASNDSGTGGFFDSTFVDYWVESPVTSFNGRQATASLLVRPIKKINDNLNARLGLTFTDGNLSLKTDTMSMKGLAFEISDPYLMLDGLIAKLGTVDLGGYLRYYIPVSPDSRAADRAAYFRGVLAGSVSVVDGVNFGLSAEYRFYAYHGDGTGTGDRTRMRTTFYASLSGDLGKGLSFHTSHGIRFDGTENGGFNDAFYAYNQSMLYAKVGDSNLKVGVGLIEEKRPWDSEKREPDTQNILYSPHYTHYVLNVNNTF